VAYRNLMASAVLGILTSAALPGLGAALEPSGTTVGVNPATEASGPGGGRILNVQGPVYMGDEIRTDRAGQAQILFVDNTRFVVGANSKVLIDSFVFDPSKTAQDVGINAVKGTFRFITGASPKNAYAVRTPTMVIGVRGTAFDLAVRPGGESTIAVHEGGTQLCDARRQCIDAGAGEMIVAPPGGGFRSVVGRERRQRVAVFFKLMQPQAGLQAEFQVQSPISTPTPNDGPQSDTDVDMNPGRPGGGDPGGDGGGDNGRPF